MLLQVIDNTGNKKAEATGKEMAVLAYKGVYEPGDRIRIQVPAADMWYVIRIDDTMDEALVYLTETELNYEIPFDEKKKSYNPKAFTGERHYLTLRGANDWELRGRRNLAKNVLDQHGYHGCFPHAWANVETRGESVFAARNAIDGVVANLSHGSWPFESWGINQQKDAAFTLEFGRPVDMDELVLYTRADFPHDNWWVNATVVFSDGTIQVLEMEKRIEPHRFPCVKKGITWLRLEQLIQAEDPSPFPALTQIEVYGTDSERTNIM